MEAHVAEATTSNVLIRVGDEWATPPVTEDILEGITRRQIMDLLREDFGVTVTQRRIHRSELYACDEALSPPHSPAQRRPAAAAGPTMPADDEEQD
ncbi:aminotransferase class IV [Nonomuraea longispora]|uniref:aminotransferase class IV n=1 Tax=Nonomuraea longispora TaxID=1848320 RepID=UPI001404A56D|nr:aminotransferase class IV [Nonomuraea longispora]